MGSMCNFVSPRPVMPPHTITFALCFTWKAGGTSRSCKPQTISFFGLAYRKRYLGHSSVNKKFSQSSAVSFARFLANPKRAFLCFALNKGIFFRLKAFHPFLVIYLHTVMLETSIFSAENSWQSSLLNCYVCTLCFPDWFSSALVVRFLVCLLRTLFSTTCSPNVLSC